MNLRMYYLIAGISFCVGLALWASMRVGEMPTNCNEPFEWSVVGVVLLVTFGPFIMGYRAGKGGSLK